MIDLWLKFLLYLIRKHPDVVAIDLIMSQDLVKMENAHSSGGGAR